MTRKMAGFFFFYLKPNFLTSMATDFEILRASRTAGPLSSAAKLPALQLSPNNLED